jgi:hypothetical protein
MNIPGDRFSQYDDIWSSESRPGISMDRYIIRIAAPEKGEIFSF